MYKFKRLTRKNDVDVVSARNPRKAAILMAASHVHKVCPRPNVRPPKMKLQPPSAKIQNEKILLAEAIFWKQLPIQYSSQM